MTNRPRLEDLQHLTDAELVHSAAFAIHRERDAQLAVLVGRSKPEVIGSRPEGT